MDSPFQQTSQPQTQNAPGAYLGSGSAIFKLALQTGLLTLITLGIYRFWAKTRVRKYIWSATRLDNSPFEYTGTGLEKFIGFLIAVVLLAIYLAVIQMGLFFFGISLLREPQSDAELGLQFAGGVVTTLVVLPFIQFALYRARRYKLARTRWRGIRFGMENGAWGYAFRAVGYGALTVVSLGLLLPLATFKLEKYMTDRSWFGDAPFTQEGRWQDLYSAMKHVLIGVGLVVFAIVCFVMESVGAGIAFSVLGVFWSLFGLVHYSVQSFGYLTRNKRLGQDITFESRPSTGTVFWTYVGGVVAVSVLTGIAFAILGVLVGAEAFLEQQLYDGPGIGAVVLFVVGYIVILVGAGALALSFIIQPIIAHYVKTIVVQNVDGFATISQRAYDKGADAEGFADALDIGGGI